ncbi:hypothetical protein JCM19992_02250 [Thermostilla marina]
MVARIVTWKLDEASGFRRVRERTLLACAAWIPLIAWWFAWRLASGALHPTAVQGTILVLTLQAALLGLRYFVRNRIGAGRFPREPDALLLLSATTGSAFLLPCTAANILPLGLALVCAFIPLIIEWCMQMPVPDTTARSAEPADGALPKGELDTESTALESNTAVAESPAPVDFEADAEALEEEPKDDEELLPPGCVQQIVRQQSPGGESISGFYRVLFEPGEKAKVVHVAFCPPFSSQPKVRIEPLEGPDVRLNSQVFPQGVRITARLSRAQAEPCEVLLYFEAIAEVE